MDQSGGGGEPGWARSVGGLKGRWACQVGCPPTPTSPSNEPALAEPKNCWFPRGAGGWLSLSKGRSWTLLPGPGSVSLCRHLHSYLSVSLLPSPHQLPAVDPASQHLGGCRSWAHSPACRPPTSGPLSGTALLGGASESV